MDFFCFSKPVWVFVFALQPSKKVTSDPSPFVQFRVGQKSFDSQVRCLVESGGVNVGSRHPKSFGVFWSNWMFLLQLNFSGDCFSC